MKNKLLIGAICVSGLFVTGCSDTFDFSSDSEGRILLNVDLSRDVDAPKAESKSRAAQAMAITADQLKLTLTATDGTFEKSWASYTEFDVKENFGVGAYTMSASYGNPADEGFDTPYYYGDTPLQVKENEITPVNITATLANSMVTLKYTDAVLNYFKACTSEVVGKSGVRHAYPTDETRTLYVQPGSVSVNTSFTKQNGTAGNANVATFTAEPRNHYIVTIDVNDGEVGGGQLVITFNSSLAEEQITFDISDEILTAPAPVVTAEGFTPGTPLAVIESTSVTNAVAMSVKAQGIVHSGVLTTTCASLIDQGWPETVDFATANQSTLNKLEELGLLFKGLTGTKSKMAYLDFKNVFKNVEFDNLTGRNSFEFTFVAKDNSGKTSEPMTLKVNVEKLSIILQDFQPVNANESELKFNLLYNGSEPEKTVKFQIKNSRGTWEEVPVVSIAPAARETHVYSVAVTVPDDGSEIVLRAVSGNVESAEYPVARTGAIISLDENNVFATRSAVTVTGSDANAHAASAQVMLSTDGVKFNPHADKEVSATDVRINGLTPATKYFVKLSVNKGETNVVSFTTEAAAQLPNSGMDEWYGEKVGNWQIRWFPGEGSASGWSSMNRKTTHHTSNAGTAKGAAYCATSGTMPVNANIAQEPNANHFQDRQHGGANAALIRTVGWGGGNTAAGKVGACQNVDCGELFLGGNEAEFPFSPVRGMAFTSRPSSMSFFAKYETVTANGDKGVAEIIVKDAKGAVIAQKSIEIDVTANYTRFDLPLAYAANAGKAATVEVNFKSTFNPGAFCKWETNLMTYPKFANLSDGEYVGSKLYIDDIVLNY